MHGAGDVLPEAANPVTVATLAFLVERYVAALVGAAVEAHDVFTEGEAVGGGKCLGVPTFCVACRGDGDNDVLGLGGATVAVSLSARRRTKCRRIDYWDDPLPADNASCHSTTSLDEGDAAGTAPLSRPPPAALLNVGEFAAVDLHADARARSYHVSAPTVLDARSFIFPVCHDAALYQRVKDLQASRRALGRDLVDDVLMEAVREEGTSIGRSGTVDLWDAVRGRKARICAAGGVETANEKKGAVAAHKNDRAAAAKQNDAARSAQKKVDNGDGAHRVGAGLLNADVDPSWPGLNTLSRAQLW